LTLKEQLGKLLAIICEDYPPKYMEIIRIAQKKRAMITDGKDIVMVSVKGRRLNVSAVAPVRAVPAGRFSREGIVGLVDGQLTVGQALDLGLIDCIGSVSEILRFFRILSIVVFVSARSLRAYNLWNEYKKENNTNNSLRRRKLS
jgi:hypothetical protein